MDAIIMEGMNTIKMEGIDAIKMEGIKIKKIEFLLLDFFSLTFKIYLFFLVFRWTHSFIFPFLLVI